jgi:hypothetical protein
MKWFIALIFTCTSFAALGQEAKIPYPDCYCTDKTGARVEMGTMICLEVGGRDFIARCEMSLNNPMWREIKQGCLSSQLQQPALDAPLVNAPV